MTQAARGRTKSKLIRATLTAGTPQTILVLIPTPRHFLLFLDNRWRQCTHLCCGLSFLTRLVGNGGSGLSPFTTQARRKQMTKWLALAFVSAFATSAYAMTPIPVHQPDEMVTQVRLACGPGRTRANGVCVARTTIRHTRRVVRRCLRWNRGVCVRWY